MRFQQTRQEVVRICLELADRGYLAGTGGNVALRADAEHFVVTPSATDYYTLSAPSICVVRLVDEKQVEGQGRASVEAGLHARVLLARPDCQVSIHTHQPVASAYTLLDKALEVRDARRRTLLGSEVPCVGYAFSGTSILAARVARAVRPDVHAYLMRNHGAVCVGENAAQAMQRVVALESECAAFFEARAANRTTPVDPSAQALVLSALRAAVADQSQGAGA
ncbi:MAG: class II aldolase/adducin family protein [Myxococcales bacterium]|jgi:L-fuculose-phosphate aldolase